MSDRLCFLKAWLPSWGKGSVAGEGEVVEEEEEEMAATAREDGVRNLTQGPRGCEHYDRACLLKVTTLEGTSSMSCGRVWLGQVGQKLQTELLVRIPAIWSWALLAGNVLARRAGALYSIAAASQVLVCKDLALA